MRTIHYFTLLLFICLANTSYAYRLPEEIKNNDLQVINAAIEHPDGSAYFFVGKYFHQYDTRAGKLKRMGLIGKDAWYGVPANVDAALIHAHNKKGYFFRGNQYHRYDFSKKKVDKIGILNSDGWKGIEGPIDAAIMHPTNNCAYFFKGKKYYRYNFAKKKMDKIGTIGVDAWKGLPAQLDATIMHSNGRAYGFKDDHYYRYVYGKKVDKKAVIGRDGWKIFHRLDAALYKTPISKGKSYYIIDSKCLHINKQKIERKSKFGYDIFSGVPNDIDAALQHPITKRIYFFKNSKYYRFNDKTGAVDKIGIIGKDGWPGVPTNLDAAAAQAENIYFFKGTKFYVYSIKKQKVAYTGLIKDSFKGIPDYIDAIEGVWDRDKTNIGFDYLSFIKKNFKYTFQTWDMRKPNPKFVGAERIETHFWE